MTAFNLDIVHLPFSVNDDATQQWSSNEYPQSYTDGNYQYNTWNKNTHDLFFDSNDGKQFFLYETRNEIKKHNVFFSEYFPCLSSIVGLFIKTFAIGIRMNSESSHGGIMAS